jgi:DNA repair ATPase RecN
MIISHKKKFIFIHIYKTAGTSISKSLLPHARFIEKISSYYPTYILVKIINILLNLEQMGNKWINGVHKHATAFEVKKYLDKKIFDEYFKFAFVRHPMDWQVSLYEYIKRARHKDHDKVKEMTFKEFVLSEIKNKSPRQIDFLTENKFFIVDKIYKFENLEKDIEKLYKILNIDIKKNSIKHLNNSQRDKNFYKYYDNELEEIVKDYYYEDFERLGYN